MTRENDNDFAKLPFSQRSGEVTLPEPMRLGYVTQRFKQLIWQAIEQETQHQTSSLIIHKYKMFDNSMEKLLFLYRYEVLEMLIDDARMGYWYGEGNPDADKRWVKNQINNGEYHEILSLVEFILRQKTCSDELRNNLKAAFDKAPIAYFVDDVNGLPTVMPRPSSEAGDATKQAIETICEGGMAGATTHLRKAAEQINAREYADSVRESINAVESVARIIDPKANKTLGPALNSLERVGLLKHPALKEALKKLYGYTSDEQGIRHPLLDKDSADVGLDEAVFMFGACASFAAYLTNKHRQTETERDETE